MRLTEEEGIGVADASGGMKFEEFNRWRDRLGDLVHDGTGLAREMDLGTLADQMVELERRVRSEVFKVLVLGEFKVGKSTFINAMFGRKVLPAYATPTTAIINEVKWGDPPRALLYPRNGGAGQPIEVPVDELEDYVVIPEEDPDRPSPYERAEVFWPLPLCRDGVEIIDSPGLNEDQGRQDITLTYIERVDAAIFVSGNRGKLSLDEMGTVLGIQPVLGESLFFVCNRINEVEPEDRDRVKRAWRRSLSGLLPYEDRLFFVDARGALRARAEGRGDLEETNLPEVERRLQRFLAIERGRVKILVPAHHMARSLKEVRSSIKLQRNLLDTSLEDLEKRVDEARVPLDRAERERLSIVRAVETNIKEVRLEVQDAAEWFLTELAEKCTAWSTEVESKSKIGMLPWQARAQMAAARDELLKQFGLKIQAAFQEWQKRSLAEIIEARTEKLEEELGDRVRQLSKDLEDIQIQVAGVDPPASIQLEEPTASERALAAVVGGMFGDIGLAFIGARFGFKSMMKSFLPQLGVATAAVLLGLTPMGLLIALLGTSAIQAHNRADAVRAKLKDNVAQGVAGELRARSDADSAKIADGIAQKFEAMKTALDRSLDSEIKTVQEGIDAALTARKNREVDVRKRRGELGALDERLNELESSIGDLVLQVAT